MVDTINKGKMNNNSIMQGEGKLKIKRKRSDIKFQKTKRRILKHTWAIRVVLLIVIVGLISIVIYFASFLLGKYASTSSLGFLNDFVFASKEELVEIDGRSNFLILGKGGMGHEAPDLTDTMIFMSMNHKDQAVNIVSIPRDLWIDDLQAKINSAYYWGNQKQSGGGIVLAKSVAEEVIGEPVQYALVFDFDTFQRIIDNLGGLEVDVKNSFTDEKYPIQGKEDDLCNGDLKYLCRYVTVSFEKGVVLMDGEEALKYTRSRNAEGDEGTDKARSERQQQIVTSIFKQIASPSIFLSPSTINKLYMVLDEEIETDLDNHQLAVFARLLFNYKKNINSYSIPEDLLIVPKNTEQYDNLYVFIPKENNWNEIQLWFDDTLAI